MVQCLFTKILVATSFSVYIVKWVRGGVKKRVGIGAPVDVYTLREGNAHVTKYLGLKNYFTIGSSVK